MNTARNHIHYAIYSAIILMVLVIHADRPIESASSKLTIVLMGLLIFGEAVIRVLRARRERKASANG